MKVLFTNLLCLFLLLQVVSGQPTPVDKEKFFTDQSILPITLVTEMSKIFRDKNNLKKTNRYPTRFSCIMPDSTVINEQIQTEIRGHLRRDYCYIPPLRLIFKTNDSSSSVLSPLKSLKLVNGCMLTNMYNQYVLMEYLIYKIYNLLTEKSFRVRLLEVTYIDSSGTKKPIKNYGFFIEDVNEMAKRNNCREYSTGRPKSETTDRKQMTLVALFQYMIGNTDWSVTVRHNIKTIISKEDSTSRPFAVPYDFDYSGLVNTDYSIPDANFEIKSVTERLYRGYPRTMEELNETLTLFNKQKDSIFSLINSFELLSKANRKYMISYLEQFYSLIKSPGSVKYNFIDRARVD